MPKITKKKAPKVVEVPKPVLKVVPVAVPEPVVEAPTYESPRAVVYANVQVVKVLEDRGDYKRCAMSNGTTMDVPASLFN